MIWTVFRYEFAWWLRSPFVWICFLVVPALLPFFGQIISSLPVAKAVSPIDINVFNRKAIGIIDEAGFLSAPTSALPFSGDEIASSQLFWSEFDDAVLSQSVKAILEKWVPVSIERVSDRARGQALINEKTVETVVILPKDFETSDVALVMRSKSQPEVNQFNLSVISDFIKRTRLAAEGLDFQKAMKATRTFHYKFEESPDRPPEAKQPDSDLFRARFILPTLPLFFLWIVQQIVFTLLGESVVRERKSRLIEVMLSSLSAKSLLYGKILAVGVLGAIMLLVCCATAAAGFLYLVAHYPLVSFFLISSTTEISWLQIIGSLLFAIAGIFLNAFLAAGLSSRFGDPEKPVHFASLFYLLLAGLSCLLIMIMSVTCTHDTVVKSAFFMPFDSPFLAPAAMAGLLGDRTPSTTEYFISFAILAFTTVITAMWAGRAFERGVALQLEGNSLWLRLRAKLTRLVFLKG